MVQKPSTVSDSTASSAALVAATPSPVELPPPATVLMIPSETLRTRKGESSVAEVQIAGLIESEAHGTNNLSGRRRTAVARKPLGPIPHD